MDLLINNYLNAQKNPVPYRHFRTHKSNPLNTFSSFQNSAAHKKALHISQKLLTYR